MAERIGRPIQEPETDERLAMTGAAISARRLVERHQGAVAIRGGNPTAAGTEGIEDEPKESKK